MSVSLWAYAPQKCDGEEWRPVAGYEGLYEVSNYGRVRKLTWKILDGSEIKYGYRRINLSKDGKQTSFLVHRLVAEAFIPNPNGYPIINHKDECPSNNHAGNLEWCTQKHNMNWESVKEKISKHSANKSAVMSIDKKTGEKEYFPSIAEAGRSIMGKPCGGSSISEAAKGKRKSAYGRYWFYVESEEE